MSGRAGDGIMVTANSVTLDLNGHPVLGAARHLGDFAGIHLLGVKGVVVKGGEVSGFDAGVVVDFGSANTIANLSIHDNVGMANPASNLGDGVFVAHSGSNIIRDNKIIHNGNLDNVALLGVDTNNNTIRHNDIERGIDPGGQVNYSFPGLGTGIIINAPEEREPPQRGVAQAQQRGWATSW